MNYETPKIRLDESFDIQILIAYLLKEFDKLSLEQLATITVDDDTVNYFDLVSALGGLEDKGLITVEKTKTAEFYSASDKSNYMATELADKIPKSIRENTIYNGKKITAREKMEKAIKCQIIKLEQGYHLDIRFINEMGGPDLMDLKIYAPTYETAEQMEKRFFDNPTGTYRRVLNGFIQGFLTVSEIELNDALQNSKT